MECERKRKRESQREICYFTSLSSLEQRREKGGEKSEEIEEGIGSAGKVCFGVLNLLDDNEWARLDKCEGAGRALIRVCARRASSWRSRTRPRSAPLSRRCPESARAGGEARARKRVRGRACVHHELLRCADLSGAMLCVCDIISQYIK